MLQSYLLFFHGPYLTSQIIIEETYLFGQRGAGNRMQSHVRTGERGRLQGGEFQLYYGPFIFSYTPTLPSRDNYIRIKFTSFWKQVT